MTVSFGIYCATEYVNSGAPQHVRVNVHFKKLCMVLIEHHNPILRPMQPVCLITGNYNSKKEKGGIH